MDPKSILICGGGTAGWMAANVFQHRWPSTQITLIESDSVGIIGVGEGSTPYLKHFFAQLGIRDSDWMPQCNATYKVGISFPNWSTREGYEQYFHPFFSELDIEPGDPFFHNAKLQKSGVAANAHPDHYFVTAQMARGCKAPISSKYPDLNIDYGYHFDSGLLGEYLKKRAICLGLIHVVADIEHVIVDDNSNIVSVNTNIGNHTAEVYVDCTGFRSLLLQQALDEPFISYQDNLFNDSAIAIATDLNLDEPIAPQTRSSALTCGWAWQIPLTNRYGNGYVYSSKYISDDDAEQELREHLGITDRPEIKARRLKMKVGRVEHHWKNNCLAIGLSQGFIEPLEATALMLVQYTIDNFIEHYDRCEANIAYDQNNQLAAQASFNQNVNNMMEGIRDYIVTHYVTNSRDDSAYWNDCRNTLKSKRLERLLKVWDDNGDFESVLNELDDGLVYLRPSWYVLLMGVGRFTTKQNQETSVTKPVLDYKKSRDYCEQLVADVFPQHNQYLQSIYGDLWPENKD